MDNITSCKLLLAAGLGCFGTVGCAPWLIDEPTTLAAVRSINAVTASYRLDRQRRSVDERPEDEPAPAVDRPRDRARPDDRNSDGSSPDDSDGDRASPEDRDGDRANAEDRDGNRANARDRNGKRASTKDRDGRRASADDSDGDRASTDDSDGDGASTDDSDDDRASAEDRDGDRASVEDLDGERDAPEPGGVVLSRAAQRGVRNHAAQVAFDFFVGKGLTSAQAAAIVGNLMQESNLNPASSQSGGPGHGIAQWSAGARWNNLLRFAKARRASPLALTTQLQFLWHELTTVRAYGLGALRAARSVAAATRVFAKSFETCGVCNDARRIALAQATLRAYGNRAARRRRA